MIHISTFGFELRISTDAGYFSQQVIITSSSVKDFATTCSKIFVNLFKPMLLLFVTICRHFKKYQADD